MYITLKIYTILLNRGNVKKLINNIYEYKYFYILLTNMSNNKNQPQNNSQSDIKIELQSWYPIATYSYNFEDDICGLCKANLMDACLECYANNNKVCKVSQGQCDHCFHYHCISNWLKDDESCPIDNVKFLYNENDIDVDRNWKKYTLSASKKIRIHNPNVIRKKKT